MRANGNEGTIGSGVRYLLCSVAENRRVLEHNYCWDGDGGQGWG